MRLMRQYLVACRAALIEWSDSARRHGRAEDRIEPLSPDKLRDTLSRTSGESYDDPVPRANGISEVHSGLVLELYGSLRTGRREVSGGATRPNHGRRHAAEALGHPSR